LRAQHAVRVALRAYVQPQAARNIAVGPLPEHVLEVIKLAARSPASLAHWSAELDIAEDRLVEIATFYAEQVLVSPHATHYRALGVEPSADIDLIRSHYRWLMKWLHPDRPSAGWHAVLAQRVNKAWTELKDPARRAAYDQRMGLNPAGAARAGKGREPSARTPDEGVEDAEEFSFAAWESRPFTPMPAADVDRGVNRPPVFPSRGRRPTRALLIAGAGGSALMMVAAVSLLGNFGTAPQVVALDDASIAPRSAAVTATPRASAIVVPLPLTATGAEGSPVVPVAQQADAGPPAAATFAVAEPVVPEPAVHSVAAPAPAVPRPAMALIESIRQGYDAADVFTVLNLLATGEDASATDLAAVAADIERWQRTSGDRAFAVIHASATGAREADTKVFAALGLSGVAGLSLVLRAVDGEWQVAAFSRAAQDADQGTTDGTSPGAAP
jgi:hypothetical protein